MAQLTSNERYQKLRDTAQRLCATSTLLRSRSSEIVAMMKRSRNKTRNSVPPYTSSHLHR